MQISKNLYRQLIGLWILGLFSCSYPAFAVTTKPSSDSSSLLQSSGHYFYNILANGQNDLILTGYAWHNRFTYDKARLNTYNELAWGGGFGKSIYDAKGNQHSLFAFTFLDSHKKVEPAAGYAYLKTLHFNDRFNVGAGLSVFITARQDIFNGIPFPGLLPWFNITLDRASLCATYIQGARGAGNVLFIVGKWRL